MAGKRSYAAPIFLLIITGMSVLLVLVYSKLLLTRQTMNADEGQRLSGQYEHAVLFAERLHDGADLLLKNASAADRLRAKAWLGQAEVASGDALAVFSEAAGRKTGETREQAFVPLFDAMNRITDGQNGKLDGVAEHDGPLTAEEENMLAVVREGAAAMQKALDGFRPPTGDAGYRRVAAGEGWIEPATAAGKVLEEMAGKLK